MTEKEKMDAGLIYDPMVKEITDIQFGLINVLRAYNMTLSTEMEKRDALLKQMFGKIGEGCYIEPPFYANWSSVKI